MLVFITEEEIAFWNIVSTFGYEIQKKQTAI